MGVLIVQGIAPAAWDTEEPLQVFSTPLEHGQDPEVLAYDQGYLLSRTLDALLDNRGELILRVEVRPVSGQPRPVPRLRGLDRGLVLDTTTTPVVRQRVAAYAVVTSDRGLLATEYSDRTAVATRWGMPGGGLDAGEAPIDAVLREVAEETSQTVLLGELIKIQTSHWIGRSPHGGIEDFHAVRLIYRSTCLEPNEPVVVDTEGTTASARWIPLDAWRSLNWTINWKQVLDDLFDS